MLPIMKKTALFTLCALHASISYAQDDYLSAEEAMKSFEKASEMYKKDVATAEKETSFVEGNSSQKNPEEQEKTHLKENLNDFSMAPVTSDDPISLENTMITINVENKTMKAVMDEVVRQAAQDSGPWAVKWRLDEDNHFIVNERVNLTAETYLGEFIEYLVDRVNNMTGIQLFVTVFNQSRIIVISDTYY